MENVDSNIFGKEYFEIDTNETNAKKAKEQSQMDVGHVTHINFLSNLRHHPLILFLLVPNSLNQNLSID